MNVSGYVEGVDKDKSATRVTRAIVPIYCIYAFLEACND